MKKVLSAILASCLMMTCAVSCGNKKSSSDSGSIVAYDAVQKNGSAEDALKDFFTANYTRDAGEAAFNYMYTQQMIDDMIAKNEYAQLVLNYNNGKNEMLNMYKNIPFIKSIDDATPLTEEQLGWAEQYLIEFTATRGITIEDFNITEGYNFNYTIVDYNSNEKPNVACLVKVENDGWKFVSTLGSLEASYGTNAETAE